MINLEIEIDFFTEIRKEYNESIQEYVLRICDEGDRNEELVSATEDYMNTCYFASSPSYDVAPIQHFLEEVREMDLLLDDIDDRKVPVELSIDNSSRIRNAGIDSNSELRGEVTELQPNGEHLSGETNSSIQISGSEPGPLSSGGTLKASFKGGLEGIEAQRLLV